MKPVIGLTHALDPGTGNQYIRPGYARGVFMAGGLPLPLPLTENVGHLEALLPLCDGFLFTGGPDVDPAVYGEKRLNDTVELCPERDAMELPLLKLAMDAGKPILGICRGCQLINAALGGTLYQDLPTQYGGSIRHRQPEPFTRPSHENRILPDTPLHTLLGREQIYVNSCHHQAIRSLGNGLQAAVISEDGLLEGFYMPGFPYLLGVQWHPELLLDDPVSVSLFRSLIMAAGGT